MVLVGRTVYWRLSSGMLRGVSWQDSVSAFVFGDVAWCLLGGQRIGVCLRGCCVVLVGRTAYRRLSSGMLHGVSWEDSVSAFVFGDVASC